MEYDFANGVARISRPNPDCRNTSLAYWAKSRPVTVTSISSFANARNLGTMITVTVNDVAMRALFDTGFTTSALTSGAARRAGLARDGEGVVPAGPMFGVGQREVKSWIAPVKTFTIGDETINNIRLRFTEYEPAGVDLILGADFFLSHRIYVANSQGRVYMTYNGGPVFNLKTLTADAADGESEAAQVESAPLADAGAYARRAAAFAARKEYAKALADFNRACEMEPQASAYFASRGEVQYRLKQPALALADMNESLRLNPDSASVRLWRARLLANNGDKAAAEADLAAADKLADRVASIRTGIGDLYLELGHADAALAQYDQWVAGHPGDAFLPSVLNDRCWVRALMGKELDKALDDCDVAVKSRPKYGDYLTSRGLVYFRQGWLDRAHADYELALKSDPKSAWALYGRGLVQLKKGANDAGRADIAAAKVIQPEITEEAKRYGLE
jgi:tetratricopeptide (TPR) repeat protein